MIRKDPIFKTLMLSRKGTVERSIDVNDPLRFAGEGVTFRAKLIGVLEVNAPRGDQLCQEALAELKMAIKAAGEHKQRILICIALDGLRLRDERTGDCLYHHAVHKISFIAQDMTDPRAFGYIFGSPDQGHRFFGIKTDKHANLVVMAMRDLFQVVYDLKKRDVEKSKQNSSDPGKTNGVNHFTDSQDSLDQMLTLGSHLSGSSNVSSIQTGDLLNLHAEDTENKKLFFDPFDSINDPFAQAPFAKAPQVSAIGTPLTFPAPQVASLNVLSPPPSNLKPSFTDTFSDSFVNSGSNLPLTTGIVPPPKSPRTKFDECANKSISHFSTIRPRKKSGDHDNKGTSSLPGPITLPPPQNKSPALRKIPSEQQSSMKCSTAIPRPTSVSSSNASSSPRIGTLDSFDGQSFPTNFSLEAPTENFSAESAARPIDVFTELDPLGTGRSKPYVHKKDFFQDLRQPPKKRLLNELVTSDTPKAVTQSFSDDPFGSLQFVPIPEPDPFDTKFASFGAPLLGLPLTCTVNSSTGQSSLSSSFTNSVPIAKVSLASVVVSTNVASSNKGMSSVLSQEALRVSLSASHSDSDSEISIFAKPQPSPDRSAQSVANELKEVAPSVRHPSATEEVVETMQDEIQASPVLPLELSSSDSDSTSSDDQTERDVTENTNLPVPPQPPPRPPILKPPPLPPKGHPPIIPQRPVVTPTEELHLKSETPTPPLPIPIRKPKQISGERLRRISREDDISPVIPKPKSSKLSQISLFQLSNMSLSELAATLQLPPARLACMTLTELALRLAELNKENESEESSEGKDKYPEEEEEVVEIKLEEAEVCYKGGKKYEILSDAHEEDVDNTKCSNESHMKEAQDRYAALREIMEQDLAISSNQKEDIAKGSHFSDFDCLPSERRKDSGKRNSFADDFSIHKVDDKNESKVVGFDDDFIGVESPRIDDAFSFTGAKPKTRPRRSRTSISSSSTDFDPFGDEDFKQSAPDIAWNGISNESSKRGKHSLERSSSVTDPNDESDVCEEFADRFAAFEAKFPENPVEGFGDSFSDFNIKSAAVDSNNEVKLPEDFPTAKGQKSEPFADFDSAFGKHLQISQNVKKSQSVNIFKRVDDPFDDEFFQSEESAAKGSATQNVKIFSTIVEDPFAWVQPFDDNYKLDEDFTS